jgi:hypothetical protein
MSIRLFSSFYELQTKKIMASAQILEIELNEDLVNEIIRLRNAIKTSVKEFEEISWGWDGDCGIGPIIERLEDSISQENAQEHPATERK